MKHNEAYRAAETKIEEAVQSKADRLDLSVGYGGSILTELPESLAPLTHLISLNLGGHGLGTLPEWLGRFTQLRSLDVSRNRLDALPNWLPELTQLTSLHLSGNRLTALPETLGKLVLLRSLDVSRNELKELPKSVVNLINLDSIAIGSNPWSPAPLFELLERLPNLTSLNMAYSSGQIAPHVSRLKNLRSLSVQGFNLTSVPDSILNLKKLEYLCLYDNQITHLPDGIGALVKLQTLDPRNNRLETLPDSLGQLQELEMLMLDDNALSDLPASLAGLQHLHYLPLDKNPLNPELEAANKEGLDAVKRYLRAKSQAQVILNEAKLILVGEGEVGKSCLLSALRDEPWVEGNPTTHGIEIKPVKITDHDSGKEITFNGWDFGGQRVYRPTHQLFFSAPAIYLVVWKPREGPQQGFVKEWIKLVKHREPDAKVLVVATHGGPKERQPDIDRQEIWDAFGKDTIVDFFFVDSKPDNKTNERKGIAELKQAVARAAIGLPEMGREVPQRWDETRNVLKKMDSAYLPLDHVMTLCQNHKMDLDEAKDFIRIAHRLGHLIYYEHDLALRDIVILKPDWLSTALSYVLDDKQTRDAHGLVEFSRRSELWNDPARPVDSRYDADLHPLFLRLMERFDISYKVAIPSEPDDAIGFWQRIGKRVGTMLESAENRPKLHYTSLIAQLVPDVRPDPILGWPVDVEVGDLQQAQICRIVETKSGQSAVAEGLFYQLIVRLHKFSLGRADYRKTAHWQRGVVLEDDYGARALLEHVGSDVHITVRSPYPERFLSALTYEVKWLVENFWAGLRCDVMVPCLNPDPCLGLFEVRRLIENMKRNRPEQPCPVCNEWQDIQLLLHNAPAARANPLSDLLANLAEVMPTLTEVRRQLDRQHTDVSGRFDRLDASHRELVTKVEAAYSGLMRTLVDEAKDGPRLFSLEPVDSGFLGKPRWISETFRLVLWCEHSRLPLPVLNDEGDKRGIYEMSLPREWVVRAAPFLSLLSGALSLMLPVAASATKLMLNEASYKGIEKQLDFGQRSLDSFLKGGEKAGIWLGQNDSPDLEQSDVTRAQGAALRQLHVWLKEKDPSFGGLVRVQNRRQEFLWVHPKFESEY
jgi:C-terminal of Roc, COR, domain/Ras of Complex, Roc, domain of DAPkinase/Leucine rich repeat